ncbi:DUF1493 family protein [Acidocella sp.]|uniref:DUF1493 family protein n=1 Tax=Acidocella sp. TaxID=50710 RepID=UPI00260EC661|nr:DUF1493 family protein [Acidocella sp.]
MDDSVRDGVVAIVARFAGAKKPIPLATSINHKLPIHGDDAYELLVTIKKQFGTNFEGLDFDRYFWNETEALLWPTIWRLLGRRGKDNLTVQHLVDVVRQGVWFD